MGLEGWNLRFHPMTSGGQRREEGLQVLTQSPRVSGLIIYTYVMKLPRRATRWASGPAVRTLPTQVLAQVFWLQRTETHSSYPNRRAIEGYTWTWVGPVRWWGPGTGPR